MLLSPVRGRGWVRGLHELSMPPHLASPPSGGEELETDSIASGNPRQAAELDAFLGQRLGFIIAGLAVYAALVALAVMDLAGFLGELVTDMLAVLLDLGADLDQRLAQLLGHVTRQRGHLLLVRRRRGRRCRRIGRRLLDLDLPGALAQPRRHRCARDLGLAAHGAADQGFLLLPFVGLAVLEPAFELVALGAAQSV